MLVNNLGTQCSTSYAHTSAHVRVASCDRHCTSRQWSTSSRHSCRSRVHPVAAAKGSTDLVEWSKRPNELITSPLRPFGGERRYVDLQQTKDQSWADEFEQNDSWSSFWDDESLMLDDPSFDDTYDGLFTGSAANTTLVREAKKRIVQDLTSPQWRETHPNYISPPPVPLIKKYQPDIPDPMPIAPQNWTEWELRAWVEKRRRKEQTDAAWQQRQQLIGRFTVLNINEENDSRLKYGFTTIPRTWTHEEILGVITNNGINAKPEDVKSLKVQDPEGKADYFVEGVHYVPETDEYLAEIGHLWEAENEPDLEQEVSMLASDFSGLDAANNQTGEDEQEGAPAPRDGDEDDSAGPNDEAAQLGKFFGGDL